MGGRRGANFANNLLALLISEIAVKTMLVLKKKSSMERRGLSYGEVVRTQGLRVQALLGRSKNPTSRSPEAVDWIM